MSKKDFELIATVIRNYKGDGSPDSIARAFGAELLNANPRFDLKRFVATCVPVEN